MIRPIKVPLVNALRRPTSPGPHDPTRAANAWSMLNSVEIKATCMGCVEGGRRAEAGGSAGGSRSRELELRIR